MPKQARWTAEEAERLLLNKGFSLVRTHGSHRIYRLGVIRIVVPFHAGRLLHPKICKQVQRAIDQRHGPAQGESG